MAQFPPKPALGLDLSDAPRGARIDVAAASPVREELLIEGLEAALINTGSDSFAQALEVAARAYSKPASVLCSPADAHSRIYAIRTRERLLGTLSVAYARDGRLSSEDYFPRGLIAEYRPVICSAYRLAVDPSCSVRRRVARVLMRLGVSEACKHGMRLGVVAVRSELSPYYLRYGYLPLKGHAFLHPRLRTPHRVFVCPCDPDHKCLFTDIFRLLDAPLRLRAIESYLDR